jgi:hypothetical protein
MRGEHFEGPCFEGRVLHVTQVDMGPWDHTQFDSVIA